MDVLHLSSIIFPPLSFLFLLMEVSTFSIFSSILVCSGSSGSDMRSLYSLLRNVPVAKWITRLPPKEKIAGSIPARDAFDEV